MRRSAPGRLRSHALQPRLTGSWEHAFTTAYGTDRASYIEAFMANVDWKEIDKRLVGVRSVEVAHH
jgi:hypothetical protein